MNLNSPEIYEELFAKLVQKNKEQEFHGIKRSVTEEFNSLSRKLQRARIQDASSVRNVLMTRAIAVYVVNESGEIDCEQLKDVIQEVEKHLYPLGVGREDDVPRQEFLLKRLKLLHDSEPLRKAIVRLPRPSEYPVINQTIRETMLIPPHEALTDADVRRAAVSAYLSKLRQSVGSCFGTAPAIIVHEEQPEAFIKDLDELFSTGKISRVVEGEEFIVPFSYSWGAGELKRVLNITSTSEYHYSPGLLNALDISRPEELQKLLPENTTITVGELIDSLAGEEATLAKTVFKALSENAMLKSWEYTIASFTESKSSFSKWNLYTSLGFDPKLSWGIGECIYQILEQKVAEANRDIEKYQIEYEQLFQHVKHLEGRLKRASQDEIRWLKAEYEVKRNEFYTAETFCKRAKNLAHNYAHLFNYMIDKYLKLFPEFFQEIYDPDLKVMAEFLFDDSPAGFQLLFKHGRANPSQWTRIDTLDEYIQSLKTFFIMTEQQIIADENLKGLEEGITAIITAVVNHVKTEEFINSSFHRMAGKYGTLKFKEPLKHLEKIEKKPWSYTSGGSIDTLISCYFRRGSGFQKNERWVESTMELLVFLVDVMKETGVKDGRLLMHSPTHAFTFLPTFKPFSDAWHEQNFTYTWVRDQWVDPRKKIIDHLKISHEGSMLLMEHFPDALNPPFAGELPVILWRNDVLRHNKSLKTDELDSILYEALPLIPKSQVAEAALEMVKGYGAEEALKKILRDYPLPKYMRADRLKTLVKTAIATKLQRTSLSEDLHTEVAKNASELGYALPLPILFADTNWTEYYFGFTVGPGTGELELWRFNATGERGVPMHEWRRWLDGSDKEKTWCIYSDNTEYTF